MGVGGILAFDLLEAKGPDGFSIASVNGMIFAHDPDFIESQATTAGLSLVRKRAQVFNYITAMVDSPGYLFTFKKCAS